MTLLDATIYRDAHGDPVITGVFRVQAHVDADLGRLWESDRQLHHILTHSVPLADRPKNAKERRAHGIARVLYTWIRREDENADDAAADVLTLLPLGRTDRWKAAIRSWAYITRTDPVMFVQYSIYANYAAD